MKYSLTQVEYYILYENLALFDDYFQTLKQITNY